MHQKAKVPSDEANSSSVIGPSRSLSSVNGKAETASLRFCAQFVLAAAAVLLLPALWSLLSAMWSAATAGQVMVLSVGRYETSRAMVPWPQGWARFIGPLLLLASLSLWLVSRVAQRAAFWWLSAALALVGIVLLLFSAWFISWRGVLWFCSLAAFVAASYAIGTKLGRAAMVAFMLAVFGMVGWQAGGSRESFAARFPSLVVEFNPPHPSYPTHPHDRSPPCPAT